MPDEGLSGKIQDSEWQTQAKIPVPSQPETIYVILLFCRKEGAPPFYFQGITEPGPMAHYASVDDAVAALRKPGHHDYFRQKDVVRAEILPFNNSRVGEPVAKYKLATPEARTRNG